MYKIAVIEDDTLLGQALVEMLTSHGYQAFAAESVTKARRLLERQPVDLLLIDRGLADGDGVELCRQRSGQEKLPAIFLTARDEEEGIVEAFDAGADDYLVKPVALAVLLKHIEAVLRRTGGEPNQVFYYQDFSLDYDRKEARIQGQPVALTPKEYEILEVLTRNQKKVVTKRMLLEQVWDDGGNFVEENTLHVTLNRLKKKIEPDPAHPDFSQKSCESDNGSLPEVYLHTRFLPAGYIPRSEPAPAFGKSLPSPAVLFFFETCYSPNV